PIGALADYLPRRTLFLGCAVLLLLSSLAIAPLRGRLVALYGCTYALSQLSGPLLLGVLGTDHDYGFWVGVGLLIVAPFLLLGRSGRRRRRPSA
ncbi:hypothetical protein ACQXY5_11955, partial [Corynebacterium diphtheriae]